jgi:hypothetical protein
MIIITTKDGKATRQTNSAPPPKRVKLAYKSMSLHKKILKATATPKTMGELALELPDAHPKTLGYHVRKLINLGKLNMHGSPSHKGSSAATYQSLNLGG